MGVLNVTPDSFSDGGELLRDGKVDVEACLQRAETMVAEGADILDIGGESTRPGAEKVGENEECDRVLPVVEAICGRLDAVVSVDTSSPTLMREATLLGAGLINDVRALQQQGALSAAAESGLAVCLMHMRGEPGSMQEAVEYDSVLAEVSDFLSKRISACENAGIARDKLILDPGIGFGKLDEHNLTLLRQLPALVELGCPVLIGVSRKSMLGRLLNRDVKNRLAGSLSLAMEALRRGASILRVHDVAETADAVKIFTLMNEATQ